MEIAIIAHDGKSRYGSVFNKNICFKRRAKLIATGTTGSKAT
jgi:methylglyoxal synthase